MSFRHFMLHNGAKTLHIAEAREMHSVFVAQINTFSGHLLLYFQCWEVDSDPPGKAMLYARRLLA